MKDARSKINAAQLNVLVARLKSGKPLTNSQMRFVEAQFPETADPVAPGSVAVENDYDVASNVNELANRLGVHRQTIAYHRGRAGSPDDLSISRWREYLVVMGKIQTSIRLDREQSPAHKTFDCDTAFSILFTELSDSLPVVVRAALDEAGVKASPHRADITTFCVWFLLAVVYQRLAKKHDAQGPLDPAGDTDVCEYPDEIKKLAARINKTRTKGKPVEPAAPGSLESSNDLQ